MSDTSSFLSVGTLLQSKYRILRHLASGGFGNTYLARHIDLEQDVVIKEFFMRGVNVRDTGSTTVSVGVTENKGMFSSQREKFKKEAQRIFRLRNDHIVRVLDFFDANNTSYYVMDYIEGESLSALMRRVGRPFSESQTLDILRQLLDALKTIHGEHIWHMDIKPGNIMIDRQGLCQLIDFGSSKQTDRGGNNTSTAMTYTPGYAPSEQVNGLQQFWGPWTDLYALGATLYNLLTGNQPPQRDEIDVHGDSAFFYPPTVSQKTRSLVRRLMQPVYTLRPQSEEEVVAELNKYADTIVNVNKDKEKLSDLALSTLLPDNTLSSEETDMQNPDEEVVVIPIEDNERSKADVVEEHIDEETATPQEVPESSFIPDVTKENVTDYAPDSQEEPEPPMIPGETEETISDVADNQPPASESAHKSRKWLWMFIGFMIVALSFVIILLTKQCKKEERKTDNHENITSEENTGESDDFEIDNDVKMEEVVEDEAEEVEAEKEEQMAEAEVADEEIPIFHPVQVDRPTKKPEIKPTPAPEVRRERTERTKQEQKEAVSERVVETPRQNVRQTEPQKQAVRQTPQQQTQNDNNTTPQQSQTERVREAAAFEGGW